MEFDCSDYLIFTRGADFFIYDKGTSYLYPIDKLHYAIAVMIRESFLSGSDILELRQIIDKIHNYDSPAIKGHYDDVIKIFSRRGECDSPSKIFSLRDIHQSISIVPQIVLEVTEQCNLQCAYCYYGKMYNNSSERIANMNEENCIKVLRELLSIRNVLYNKISISFYGGEPLLNFRLIRTVVMFCKNEFPGIEYSFSFTTNGTLLKRHIDFLEENNFKILVSLDGSEKDNINRVYKNLKPSFSEVNQTVEYLFQQHHDYFMNNVEFISVLHSKSDIIAIIKYFSKFGKTPLLTNLSLEGINASRQSVYPYDGVSKGEMSQLYELNKNIYDLINDTSESGTYINLDGEMPLSPDRKPLRGCDLFSNKIFLAAEETIYLCEKSSRNFPFGDFKNGKLSFYINAINEYYKRIDESIDERCSGCAIKALCKRCFFSEPSLMSCTAKCKLSESQIVHGIINTLDKI